MLQLIVGAASLFFAWLLGRAVWHKMRAPEYFYRVIGDYIPGLPLRRLLLSVVIACEGGLAILLLLPSTRLAALLAAAALLLVYAGLMSWKLFAGAADMACGCSGPDSALLLSPVLVLRNLLCVALALGVTQSGYQPVAGAGTVALAAGLAAVYVWSDLVIANAQHMNEDV